MKSFLYYSGAAHVLFVTALVVMGTLLAKPRMSYYAVDLMSSPAGGGAITPGPVVSPERTSAPAPKVSVSKVKVAPPAAKSSEDDVADDDTMRMLSKLKKKRLTTPKREIYDQPRGEDNAASESRAESRSGSAGHGGGGLPGSGSGIVADTAGTPFPFPWYLKAIADRLDKQWKPPHEFEADTVCQVSFVIGRDGQISGSRLTKTSGDSMFDQLAMRAVLYSNPMPPLPNGFPDDALKVHMKFVGKRY